MGQSIKRNHTYADIFLYMECEERHSLKGYHPNKYIYQISNIIVIKLQCIKIYLKTKLTNVKTASEKYTSPQMLKAWWSLCIPCTLIFHDFPFCPYFEFMGFVWFSANIRRVLSYRILTN